MICEYVLLAIATARLTRLIIADEITEPLRERVWRRFGNPGESKISYLFTCPWCMSIYAATCLMTLYSISTTTGTFVSAILAFSYVTGILSNRVE